MGNFPGAELLRKRYEIKDPFAGFGPLALESVARHTENETMTGAGRPIAFTDFQHRLYGLLGGSENLSFSAPTSAGKSFVLALDVVRQLIEAPNIMEYIPVHPNQGRGETLKQIFRTIDECLLGVTNESYTFFGWIATGWMLGDPLIKIFNSRIGYLREKKPAMWANRDQREVLNDEIRKVLRTLEQEIHFRYVRYTRAYLDLLIVALRARGMENLAERVLPIHIYLEFGTCDELVLALVSLGLSRTTALLLRRSLGGNWPAEINKATLRARLEIANYHATLPQLCVEEIDELVFGRRASAPS